MTMTSQRRVACGHCGASRTFRTVLSTHTWGSPDLDYRAPPDARYLLELAVQCCEFCGYCAAELARQPSAAQRAWLREAGYRQRLSDPVLPVLAGRLRAAAELRKANGDILGSARWLLAAAWACDDEAQTRCGGAQGAGSWSGADTRSIDPLDAAGAALREQAATDLEAALYGAEPDGDAIAPRLDDDLAMIALQWVDTLRRAGRFKATVVAVRGLLPVPTEGLSRHAADAWEDALHAQLRLAQGRDSSRRTFADALAMRPESAALAAARAARDAEQRRHAEARAARLRDETEREITPVRCLDRIAALMDEAPQAHWGLAQVRELPMPAAVCEDLAGLAADEGWSGPALLAGIALAVLSATPGLARGYASALPGWYALVEGNERMTTHLNHVFRRCTPNAWHYWPPAGQRVFSGS